MRTVTSKKIFLSDREFMLMVKNYLDVKDEDKFEILIDGKVVAYGAWPEIGVEIYLEETEVSDA